MLRRQFLYFSGYLIINATVTPLLADSDHKPSFPFMFGRGIHALRLPIADCTTLEAELRAIESIRKELRSNWTGVAGEYKQRAQTKIAYLRGVLNQANETASRAQRRKYIHATLIAAGLAIAGFGILIGSPIAIGAALGAQVLLGPTEILMQTVFDAFTDEISLATVVVDDRAFLIGGVAGKRAAQPIARVLGRSMVAVQLALDAWQLSQTVQEQIRATEQARMAREALTQVENAVQEIDANPRFWAALYLRHLTHTATALEHYIERTRETNCRMPLIETTKPSFERP